MTDYYLLNPSNGYRSKEELMEVLVKGPPMSSTTRARLRAAIVAIAPAVLLAAFVYHPYISNLAVGVGSGLVVLAFLAIRSYLREAGEERWSILALPFIVMGSTLFAFPPAMEIAMLGAAEAGADVQAVLTALDSWFFPILLTAAVTFAIGVFAFAKGIVDSRILSRRLTWLVVGALVVMAVARLVPVGAVQFYVQGAAGIVALWPLAYEMWKHPEAQPAVRPRPMPAT